MGTKSTYLMNSICKRCIAMISSVDPNCSALIVEGENSHNFYPESLENCLHYSISIINSILLSDNL